MKIYFLVLCSMICILIGCENTKNIKFKFNDGDIVTLKLNNRPVIIHSQIDCWREVDSIPRYIVRYTDDFGYIQSIMIQKQELK